jgi:response regulator RpfG family c-di-GMP phosphodiesterase
MAPTTKILYVDDEEANLFLFKINFQSKFSVLTAKSGDEGLALLEANHDEITVVISDMRMPKMNGIEFIRKAREKFSNICYFILTGYDYDDEIDKAIKSKMVLKYFTKPFEMNEIESAIKEATAN